MCTLSIVLVNWNAGAELLDTLETLYQSLAIAPDNEVILVDNNSTDNSPQAAVRRFPQLRVVHNSANVGFGAACNIGFMQALGRYVLLINPDVRVQGAALEAMLTFMETHSQAGICGPKLLESDNVTVSPWCARRDPQLWDVFFEYAFLTRVFPRHHLFARCVMGDWDHASNREVDALSGACLLARREVIQQTGGFDEHFFMYGEDLDWCRRIRLAGWQVWFIADAEVIHLGGHSTVQISDHGARWGMESHLCYFRKWGNSMDELKLRLILSIGCIIRAIVWGGMPAIRPRQFRYALRRATYYIYDAILVWTI